jgi:feruloyl-CoA synthase
MSQPLRDTDADVMPMRPVRLGPRDVVVDRRPDGTIYLRSPFLLAEYPKKLTDRLKHWAETAPDRVFVADRDQRGEWRKVTYSETLHAARAIGTALLKRNLSAERPIVILSGNDVDHAMLGLAAQYIGVPYAPVSPAYSLVSGDFGKLRYIIKLLTPGLVFVADGSAFAKAIDAVVPKDVEVVVVRNPLPQRPTTPFSELMATQPAVAVDAVNDRAGPDTIAKFLFTSGSTGNPKAVINTQRMLCSNQAMILSSFRYFADEPPVLLDWAPWNHTAGGNHNVGLVLYNGGSFYIDDGKPVPGGIEATVRNLRDVATNWYFNVPKGYDALIPYLRDDRALREKFFSDVKLLFVAGAGLAQHQLKAMQDLAIETRGERILFSAGFGSTETGPFAMVLLWHEERSGNLGVPGQGVEIKLAPTEGKLELRVRSPSVTPGYWRTPELTAKAFDEEGFYKMGDAVKFVDPNDPGKGFWFDGRVTEDFKLNSGTWVSVGPLRAKFIDHFAPYAKDVVIAGLDREVVGVLVFPNLDQCRVLAGLPATASAGEILGHAKVREKVQTLLRSLASLATGSSNRVSRAILLTEPPSIDAGEMTDKGSINQRAVLANRGALVEALYAKPTLPNVIAIDGKN